MKFLVLMSLIACISCQSMDDQCIDDYFNNLDNADEALAIFQNCGSLFEMPDESQDETEFTQQLCANEGCLRSFRPISHACNFDIDLACRLVNLPTPSPEQAVCLNETSTENAVQLDAACGSIDFDNFDEILQICSNEGCLNLVDDIHNGRCGYNVLPQVCGSTALYAVPLLVLVSTLLSILF